MFSFGKIVYKNVHDLFRGATSTGQSDVMTYFGLSTRSAVYYEVGSPLQRYYSPFRQLQLILFTTIAITITKPLHIKTCSAWRWWLVFGDIWRERPDTYMCSISTCKKSSGTGLFKRNFVTNLALIYFGVKSFSPQLTYAKIDLSLS
jgi:hypothetical protein